MEEIGSQTPHTRKGKHLSTPSKVIIQSHHQSYVFDKRSYNQEFLQGIITKLEWEEIVSEASRVMGVCWSKKKRSRFCQKRDRRNELNNVLAFEFKLFQKRR